MTSFLRRWRGPVEVAKNIAEIAGLLLAGSWAVIVFSVKECPNLERRLAVNPDIAWSRIDGRCIAAVSFEIQNKGTLPVEVTDVQLAARQFSLSVYGAKDFPYLDRVKMHKTGTPLDAPKYSQKADTDPQGILQSPLIGHYPVSSSFRDTYEWSFPDNVKDAVYFSATVTAKGIDAVPVGDVWSRVCGDEPAQKPQCCPGTPTNTTGMPSNTSGH